jgi:Fur family iron response transcriptional regulator
MKPEIYHVTPSEAETAREILERKGIRTTQQRLALCAVLFRNGQRHVSAEELHQEARRADVRVSAATVYNTLNHFAEASLIRRVSVGGQRIYFDTYAGDHQHFYIEAEDRILDIPPGSVTLGAAPTPPPGYTVSKIDLVVHLEPVKDAMHETGE